MTGATSRRKGATAPIPAERRKGVVIGLVSAHAITGQVLGQLVDALIEDGTLQQELQVDDETVRLLLTMLARPVIETLLASAREVDSGETDRAVQRIQAEVGPSLQQAIEPYLQQLRAALREVHP